MKALKNNKPLVFGYHAVESLLLAKPDSVASIMLQKGRHDERVQRVQQLAAQEGINIAHVGKKTLDDYKLGNHQGFVAQCHHFPNYTQADLLTLMEKQSCATVLVLDGVQDPHNLGAIMRTCDAMGVCAIVIPKDNAVGMTPAVQKVACGAAMTVPLVTVTNLSRCMQQLQDSGLWLVGLDMLGENRLSDIDLTGPIGIVMGSEGSGMRRKTRERCDFLAHVPMHGTVESMNVSVVTGMALYEVQRQKLT